MREAAVLAIQADGVDWKAEAVRWDTRRGASIHILLNDLPHSTETRDDVHRPCVELRRCEEGARTFWGQHFVSSEISRVCQPHPPSDPMCEDLNVRRLSAAMLAVFASFGLGACSTTAAQLPMRAPNCSTFSGFELSLASDRGGQPSPARAAEWFAVHGGVPNIPAVGWVKASTDGDGVSVYSGRTILHVIQGTGGTWLVDSGKHC